MRNFLTGICVTLLFTATVNAATCPPIKDIVLSPGEYSWFSNQRGWEGGFISPTQGKGKSTRISHFIQANWIQLNNHADSLGYVVCDYKGNYDDEVIRFTQTHLKEGRYETHIMTKRPSSINWNCQIMPDYPSTACICSGLEASCSFSLS